MKINFSIYVLILLVSMRTSIRILHFSYNPFICLFMTMKFLSLPRGTYPFLQVQLYQFTSARSSMPNNNQPHFLKFSLSNYLLPFPFSPMYFRTIQHFPSFHIYIHIPFLTLSYLIVGNHTNSNLIANISSMYNTKSYNQRLESPDNHHIYQMVQIRTARKEFVNRKSLTMLPGKLHA